MGYLTAVKPTRLLPIVAITFGALVMQCNAKAEDNETLFNYCLAVTVQGMRSNDYWFRARDAADRCACKVNRHRQGLMADDCGKVRVLTHEQVREYYGDM